MYVNARGGDNSWEMVFPSQAAPLQYGVREYYNQTTLHPLGLVILVLLVAAALYVKRKHAFLPMVFLVCFVPPDQRVVIATLDFNFIRLLALAGMVRVALRGEYRTLRWTKLDSVIIAWCTCSLFGYVAQTWEVGRLIYKLGATYDVLALYFFFRCTLRSWPDVERLGFFVVSLSLPTFVLFVIEMQTGRNPYAFMGGVPALSTVRDGVVRSQGPFQHPILAGCAWAVLLPFAIGLWKARPGRRLLSSSGILAMLGTVVASGSSTPVLAVASVVGGFFLFAVRRHMQVLRWSLLGLLISLHFAMKAPIWHLISRIDVFGGSTGYHRYYLIDRAIAHFGEWWLVGTPSTAHWGHGLFDVTNHYIREGADGGFLSLLLFVAAMAIAFFSIGRLWRRTRSKRGAWFAWALGVCVLGHATMFIAVPISNSQQNLVIYLLVLATIAGQTGGQWSGPRRGPQRSAPGPGDRSGRTSITPEKPILGT